MDPYLKNTYNNGVNGYGEALPGYTPPPAITSSMLAPTAAIAYNTPSVIPPPAIPPLDAPLPPLTATPIETKASDLSTRIATLNDSLNGKSAYKTAQEASAGIPELTQSQNDLATQVKQLQNEALQIPLQIQNEATGRGITTAGLAPLQTARVRTNAIQALGVSSLLDASKGLIASAQAKVDRAVSAKYDPIQEQIATATKNLELLLKDPALTLEDKNRAQAQLDLQNKKTALIAKNKEDTATIMSWAAAALANGASPYVAQQIMTIAQSNSPDLKTAFGVYAPYAKDPKATEKAVLELEKTRAEIGKSNADTAKTYADIGKVNADTAKQNAELAPSADKVSKADSVITQIQSILNDPNLSKAVGPVSSQIPEMFRTGARNDVEAKIKSLIAGIAIENLSLLKGPMSDKDVAFIKEASSGLNTNMSEQGFKDRLNSIKDKFEEIKKKAGGDSTNADIQVVNGKTYKKGADGLYYEQQ